MGAQPCPDETEVAELFAGRLPDAQRTRLFAHAADCDACRELLAELLHADAESSEVKAASDVDQESHRSIGATLNGMWGQRYRLLRTVGAGGMGIVYEAYDHELDRRVALKMLRGHKGDPQKARRRALVREARAMAKLNHPNVVQVFDVVEDGDRLFVTMEFASGGTLRHYLTSAPRTFSETAQMFLEAGQGLQAAHEAGLIHRDFKPENVLLRGQTALVTDFGLARHLPEMATMNAGEAQLVELGSFGNTSVTATQATGVAGTLLYMAPEQLRGEELDARADVYSYAVAFWEGCCGKRPFEGRSVAELMAAIAAGPSNEQREIPRSARRALTRALSFDRSVRTASMEALMVELRASVPKTHGALRKRTLAAALLTAGLSGAIYWHFRPAVAAHTAPIPALVSVVTTAGPAASTLLHESEARHEAPVPPQPLARAAAPNASTMVASPMRSIVSAPASSTRGPGGVFVKSPY